MNKDLIYLDHAAATPLDARVFAAMQPYFHDLFFNPSSPYAQALSVRRDYEDAKHRIAQAIGAKSDELVMTAGATESINLAFASIGGHIITSPIEHHAVLASAMQYETTFAEVDDKGVVKAESIKRAIRPDTRLISIALANNELGTIQPLRAIASLVHEERKQRLTQGNTTPLYIHSDASQGAGQIDVHVTRLGIDLLTLNAGKMYGPKQVGLLWAASGVILLPHITGGGQERGIRSGTENVAGTVGFATALELAEKHRKFEAERLSGLRDRLQSRLLSTFEAAIISGHQKRRLPGHLHISFPGIDAERLVFGLEARGVMVATGSACAANKGTRSHVLTAIGLAPDVADGSVRITLGHLTDESVIARAADILVDVIQKEYDRMAR